MNQQPSFENIHLQLEYDNNQLHACDDLYNYLLQMCHKFDKITIERLSETGDDEP